MARDGRYIAPLADVERIDGADLFALSGTQSESVAAARPRIMLIALLFFIGYFALVVRSVGITIFDYKLVVPRSSTSAGPVVPRARITDRNGVLLASNIETYSINILREYINDGAELASTLSRIKGLKSEEILKARFEGDKGRANIGRRLTPATRDAIFTLGLPGVEYTTQQTRYYPRSNFAAHILGWVDVDGHGASGVERAFDQQLRENTKTPLALSIDTKIQYALEDELKKAKRDFNAKAALGVVTRISTGEVLAMANQPVFNPNAYGKFTPNDRRDRAAAEVYELGSVFKPLTLAMGFDRGLMRPDEMFDVVSPLIVNSLKINDMHAAQQPMSTREILVESSNKGAALIALKLGIETHRQYLEDFGLLTPAQIELNESANYYRSAGPWQRVTSASIGYGHGIRVSPLAFVQAMGAVANKGKLVPLTLQARDAGYVPEARQVISPEAARTVVDIMRDVVVHGTGKNAAVAGYDIAGKTGSAEKYDQQVGGYAKDRNVSSFVAVFPAKDPQYLVFILIDEPEGDAKTGGWETAGWNAAPVTANVITRIGPVLLPGSERQDLLAHAIEPGQ